MAITQEQINNIKDVATKKAVQGLFDEVKVLRGRVKEESLTSFKSAGAGAMSLFNEVLERTKQIENSMQRMSKAGLLFSRGGAVDVDGSYIPDNQGGMIAALNEATLAMTKFLGNSELGAQAINNMAEAMPQFKAFTNVLQGTAGQLAAQAATLDELGLSYSNFNKNLDLAIYSFNMTQSELEKVNQGLFNFSKKIGMMPDEVSKNFQNIARNMGYRMPEIQKQFTRIQKMAADTGVSFDTLISKFGTPLDTIGGASDFASRMNTLLGRNVYSATEVFGMNEATRMESARRNLQGSQVMRDFQSGNELLRKHALNAMAEALGMTPDQTRRLLTGERPDGQASVKQNMQKKINEGFTKAGDQLNKQVKSLADELKDNVEIIRIMRMDTTDRLFSKERERLLTPGGSGAEGAAIIGASALQQFALAPGLSGLLPAPTELGEALLRDGRLRTALKRFTLMDDETQRTKATELSEIISQLSSEEAETQKAGAAGLSSFLQKTRDIGVGQLNVAEAAVLETIDSPEIRRAILREFLAPGSDPQNAAEASKTLEKIETKNLSKTLTGSQLKKEQKALDKTQEKRRQDLQKTLDDVERRKQGRQSSSPRGSRFGRTVAFSPGEGGLQEGNIPVAVYLNIDGVYTQYPWLRAVVSGAKRMFNQNSTV